MKKLFLLSALLLGIFMNAEAQQNPAESLPQTSAPVAGDAISAGNWIVGGSLGSLGFNFDTETFRVDLQPSAGYFVSDQLVIGAMTIVGLTAYDGGTNFRYGLAPLLRYYFPEGARASGRWFGEANLGIAGSSLKDNPSDENFSFLFGVKAGYAHFVGRNVALEGTIGYIDTEADIAGSGLALGLGFQIYLPGRNR